MTAETAGKYELEVIAEDIAQTKSRLNAAEASEKWDLVLVYASLLLEQQKKQNILVNAQIKVAGCKRRLLEGRECSNQGSVMCSVTSESHLLTPENSVVSDWDDVDSLSVESFVENDSFAAVTPLPRTMPRMIASCHRPDPQDLALKNEAGPYGCKVISVLDVDQSGGKGIAGRMVAGHNTDRQLALQPCSSSFSKRNFAITIATPVALKDIVDTLREDEVEDIRVLSENPLQSRGVQSKGVRFWGVSSGQAIRQYNKMSIGDVVAFYADKKAFYLAIVRLKIRNAALAKRLWSQLEHDVDGAIFQHIYVVEDGRFVDVPITDLNQALGYSPANTVQGFTVVGAGRAARAIQVLEDACVVPQEEARVASGLCQIAGKRARGIPQRRNSIGPRSAAAAQVSGHMGLGLQVECTRDAEDCVEEGMGDEAVKDRGDDDLFDSDEEEEQNSKYFPRRSMQEAPPPLIHLSP